MKDDIDVGTLKTLYVEHGLSTREIAKRLNVGSKSTINHHLRKNGIQIRRFRPELDNEKILGLYLSGISISELAKDNNVSLWSIWKRVHNADVARSHKEACRLERSRQKVSAGHQNLSLNEWNDYISFEPYCYKFNYDRKERIRNQDGRKCVLCGKSEILNGRKLDVHHIDGDKMQGCNDKKWHLCSLCMSCNSKKDTIEKEFLIVTGGK